MCDAYVKNIVLKVIQSKSNSDGQDDEVYTCIYFDYDEHLYFAFYRQVLSYIFGCL